jgi:hypothetical protein
MYLLNKANHPLRGVVKIFAINTYNNLKIYEKKGITKNNNNNNNNKNEIV